MASLGRSSIVLLCTGRETESVASAVSLFQPPQREASVCPVGAPSMCWSSLPLHLVWDWKVGATGPSQRMPDLQDSEGPVWINPLCYSD